MNQGSNNKQLGSRGPSPASTSSSRPSSSHDDPIPPLESIAPAIFVPLERSLLEPFDVPVGEVERLKRIIDQIEQYSEDVKRNLIFMFTRERDRIYQQWRMDEANVTKQNVSPDLTTNDADFMIRNINAQPVPGRDYNRVHPIQLPPGVSRPGATPRSQAVQDLCRVIDGLVTHLAKIENMAAKEKAEQIKTAGRQK